MWNNSNYSKKTTCSEEFIDIYIQDLSIRKKATHTAVSPDFPIIDLIFNYDLSKLRVQHYSFNEADDVTENDRFIYIGWCDAFLLAILKETGEIKNANYLIETIIHFLRIANTQKAKEKQTINCLRLYNVRAENKQRQPFLIVCFRSSLRLCLLGVRTSYLCSVQASYYCRMAFL